MASVKLDNYGLYPLNYFGDVVTWITPNDIVMGLSALAREWHAEGNASDAERVQRAADRLAETAWYNVFMQYQHDTMRQHDETPNLY